MQLKNWEAKSKHFCVVTDKRLFLMLAKQNQESTARDQLKRDTKRIEKITKITDPPSETVPLENMVVRPVLPCH